jgi:predicted AAA+ superfamily ATPase
VGKTSLIEKFLAAYEGHVFKSTGDDLSLHELFQARSVSRLQTFFSHYDLVFIDEAQQIPQIGLGLKMLVDFVPHLRIIASGSSSFDLSNKLGEPLTGRQRIRLLYPISMHELLPQLGGMKLDQHLEQYLIYGTFPEILNKRSHDDKVEHLNTLRDSFLLKDLLMLENLRNASKIIDLLQLLAFQIGQQVSSTELANSLGMSKNTVDRYLDLLEKVFIIIKVRGFSRNLRKEVTKTSRYYFWDNGIRNAIISNFNFLKTRNDLGMLWENFLFIERQKSNAYRRRYPNFYFWRTYDRQEIDYVEESGGNLYGYEFKWRDKTVKAPRLWLEMYQNSTFKTINKENYIDFVT